MTIFILSKYFVNLLKIKTNLNLSIMKKIFILALMIPFLFTSCDFIEEETGLTEEEIVNGLKTALEIGTDSSCTVLHKEDGYYGDKILKILLPEEAEPIFEVIDMLEGTAVGDPFKQELDNKVEDVILGINRAAEDAADDAKPIFIDAITNMTITDGMDILQGKNVKEPTVTEFDSLAATHYLDLNTRTGLTEVFAPIIDESLNKDLLGKGLSANQAWEELVYYYNGLLNMGILQFIVDGATPIDENVTLGEHATGKALDGLFYLVGNEERKIRKDPFQWANDIIQKVFGYEFPE